MNPADKLLPLLEKVKDRPPGKHAQSWWACCPYHGDKNPSLLIDLSHDGRLLINCFSQGCSAIDIVQSVGLELSDLFPDDLRNYSPTGRSYVSRRESDVVYDRDLLFFTAHARKQGQRLTEAEKQAEREAFLRLEAGGGRNAR